MGLSALDGGSERSYLMAVERALVRAGEIRRTRGFATGDCAGFAGQK